jgi:hypothetical protein
MCHAAGDNMRTTFLLLAGQIRATTDMLVLEPTDDTQRTKAAELYGVLFYQAGGSGDEELLRSAEQTQRLFDDLRSWSPVLEKSYDPGWSYRKPAQDAEYHKMIECQREARIAKLDWYAGLARNDQYYLANKELQEFRAKNPGAVQVGTPAYAQMEQIIARMNSVSAGAPKPAIQPSECESITGYEPKPDADFRQLFSGANGIGDGSARVYLSSAEVSSSWIAHALSTEQLASILKDVDFEQQILVSIDFGKRSNWTGSIHLSDVSYDSAHERLQVSGLLGVTQQDCQETFADSYPFVIGVAVRHAERHTPPDMFKQNFADGCKTVVRGEKTATDSE